MSDFDKAIQATKVLELQVAQLHVDVQTHDPKKVTLQNINDDRAILKSFENCVWEQNVTLANAAKDDDEVKTAASRLNIIRKYIRVCLQILSTLEASLPPKPAATPAPTTTTVSVKLPKLDLPTFDGKYDEWMSFRDRFSASIVNNKSLSGCDKLGYLNATLKGEAERIIKSLPVTDANFTVAWKLLCERYENERDLVFAVLKTFFNQPKLIVENVNSLRKLVDTTLQCQRSLEVLKRPVDQWDDVLVYTVVDKLDATTKREWAKSLKGAKVPTFTELIVFLENHTRGLMYVASGKKSGNQQGQGTNLGSHHSSSNSGVKCRFCQMDHSLYSCPQFKALSPHDRVSFVKSKGMCFNCLSSRHAVKDCQSKFTCKQCNSKHNSLLHLPKVAPEDQANKVETHGEIKEAPASPIVKPDSSGIPAATPSVSSHFSSARGILLATAEVEIQDSCGYYKPVRVFLDPGSESSFITDKCVKQLGLKRKKCDVHITGIASTSMGKSAGSVTCTLRSRVRDFNIFVNCLVLNKVTGDLPSFSCDVDRKWSHMKDLLLADPQYYQPREVDILLGADVTERIYLDGRRMGGASEPIARNTEFGWVIIGPAVRSHHSSTELDNILEKFWTVEEVPSHPNLTAEEKIVEQHFAENHYRQSDGRYVAPLPYNENITKLGWSRDIALRRLMSLERRFNKNPTYREQYSQFMREYIELGHMEVVPDEECGERLGVTNYLPHHFVLKEDSSTTKLRVVFDGSAASSTGISFNQCLRVGPTIQDDIFSLLLRFRFYPVALKADIAKMYRQFLLPLQDQDRQRILWRESSDQPVKEYRLKTVTYGTASAPFAATRCLQQLVNDEGDKFPLAKRVAEDSFYVDDLMGGAQGTHDGQLVQQQLSNMMSLGCLDIRKWDSNDPVVLSQIDSKYVEFNSNIEAHNHVQKALGVQWNSVNDVMLFSGYQPKQIDNITKRTVLSEMSRVFDPLGWLSPVTIKIKAFFQLLWKPVDIRDGDYTLNWDDTIPSELQSQWQQYHEDMAAIKAITLPRRCVPAEYDNIEFHCFSDASETAYSAAIYIRSFHHDGTIESRLLVAKTKVAPLKYLSIPKLELCGALLLSRLIAAVTTAIKITAPIYAWTDSDITLKWLSTSSRRWKTFVANRVAEVQEILPPDAWHFTPGPINPADCATRGYTAEELANCKLWWSGPDWLKSPGIPIFTSSRCVQDAYLEERKTSVLTHATIIDHSLLCRYSCVNKLKRITAHALRFSFNCRARMNSQPIQLGGLSVTELASAFSALIHIAQQEFTEDIQKLLSGANVHRSSRLASLNPFLDEHGTLRVGGRIDKASVPFDNKHQIILPQRSPLTKLIVWDFHLKLHHGGFKLLLSTLHREYWIIGARNTIKGVIRSCMTCKKLKATTVTQLMGSLPQDRVTPGTPFQRCGVDYAGPFTLQTVSGRGRKQYKAYFCVFVCFAIKAVHLEAVTDLSTDAFLAAFRRFTSRRGCPTDIYSDCGTNFVGADKELQDMVRSEVHNMKVSSILAGNGVKWHFLPPSAPYQGGLWEAAVKSVKYHLRRIVGETVLTLEEFTTILCQIEGVLNSRPLCPASPDPADFDVLTPAHFLIGKPITSPPDHDVSNINVNRLSRWQRTQQYQQHLWSRWHLEYLSFLQERAKWRKEYPNVKVGDLVLIKDDNLGPLQWKRGRITAVHPGTDQKVRVVTLKTMKGSTQRPIEKICPLLPVDEQQ